MAARHVRYHRHIGGVGGGKRAPYVVLPQIAHIIGRGLYYQAHNGVLYLPCTLLDAAQHFVRREITVGVDPYRQEATSIYFVEGMRGLTYPSLARFAYLDCHE